ncbi:MAG: amidohydrolase family protein [Prevotellaceae bacterium]|jgi:cytosine/adenosine deaminase-related metal-dependent hydrolase|nr:amidohydrolase family protein [Prevotellaceae bacterium]
MNYKLKSDNFQSGRLIAGNYLFTGQEFIKNGLVEIDDEGVVLALDSLGNPPAEKAGVEFYNGIICPGFVNAHCHLELSHMESKLPQKQGMSAFCKSIMQLRNHDVDKQQEAMSLADKLMDIEGIVAVADIANTEASIRIKKKSRLKYHTFVETFGLKPDLADDIFAKASLLKVAFEANGLRATITPHAPYSLSENLFRLTVDAGNSEGIVSIHNKESRDEVELFSKKQGAMRNLFGSEVDLFLNSNHNPMQRIINHIAPDARLLLVHNTFVNSDDLEQIDAQKTTLILCPASNLYIENRLPDIDLFDKYNMPIALGTDSLSSNTSLSILKEMKIIEAHFPNIGLQKLLRWATLNGARALQMDGDIGSFDLDKRPGITLLSNIDFKNMKLTDNAVSRKIV